ncbi:MAG: HdeD family acid-resistance protein [Pseudomonadota bacterium]
MDMAIHPLASILSASWWVLLLRGLVAIAFGVLTWVQPGLSLAALVLLFGVYAFADGVLGVWTAISGRKDNPHWWVLLLWGLVSAAVGVFAFVAPDMMMIALIYYIAIWAVIVGVLQIIAAIRLRAEIKGEWLLGLAGLASVVFGVVLFARPGAGVLTLLWLIALYAVLSGILLVSLALRMRSLRGG